MPLILALRPLSSRPARATSQHASKKQTNVELIKFDSTSKLNPSIHLSLNTMLGTKIRVRYTLLRPFMGELQLVN